MGTRTVCKCILRSVAASVVKLGGDAMAQALAHAMALALASEWIWVGGSASLKGGLTIGGQGTTSWKELHPLEDGNEGQL